MRRSRVSSAGLSSRVCRSSMTSRARRPPQVSRAWAAASTESQPSGMGPSAAVKADHRWLSSVTVFASQLSARYQATGTSAAAAKPASSVLLPEPAGATTRPTRCLEGTRSSPLSYRGSSADYKEALLRGDLNPSTGHFVHHTDRSPAPTVGSRADELHQSRAEFGSRDLEVVPPVIACNSAIKIELNHAFRQRGLIGALVEHRRRHDPEAGELHFPPVH